MSSSPFKLSFAPVKSSELNRVFELESAGFPSDEAASLETINYRHKVASDLFIGAYDPSSQLIGYINATRSNTSSLEHQSMTTHQPEGPYILIHSVCIDTTQRRKGLATSLLKHYIELVKDSCSELILVCHQELKPLYLAVGFLDQGKSELVHGGMAWWEMRLSMNPDVALPQAPITNPSDLICPVSQCRCVILKAGVGKLIEKESSPLPVLKEDSERATSSKTKCWLVPNPLSFENISFTRPVGQSTTKPIGRSEMRILACGACEFGPLGWTESSENLAEEFSKNPSGQFLTVEFLLDSDRVHPVFSNLV